MRFSAALGAISQDLKMVFLVRTDLNMAKGKACAQVAHAAIMGLEAARSSGSATQKLAARWLLFGQPKVVLRVGSLQEMEELCGRAEAIGVNSAVVRDAGHTQVAPGSATVAAIGPGMYSMH